MSAWEAQSVLLVWFTPASNSVRAAAVYESVFGREADTVQTNKAPNPASPFLSVANGVLNSVQTQVAVLPGRVDLSISSVPETAEANTEIEDTAGLLTSLAESASTVSASISEVLRQALVVNLQRRAADISEALNNLDVQIEGIDLEGTLDFSLQLNKRREFRSLPGTQMNRLVRASTAIAQQISITMGNGLPGIPVNVGNEVAFSHFAIDLNTVATTGRTFSPEEQTAIWKEFIEEALHLRNEGSLKALQS